MNVQKSKTDDAVTELHPHDVISGRGNETIAYAHPGNVHFRNLVKCFKLQYVASKKADKPAFAKTIVMSIKKKSPPGRFMKQDKATGLWHDIGYKQALAKTRQALREGAPLIVKQIQRRKEEKSHIEAEQRRHLQNNLEGVMNAALQHHSSLATANAFMPNIPNSSIVDLLRGKQRTAATAIPLHDALSPNAISSLFGANNITPSTLNLNQLVHSNPIIPTNSSSLSDREANAILTGNVDALLANITSPVGVSPLQQATSRAMNLLSNQPLATPQDNGLLGSHLTFEQAISQARQTLKQEGALKEALYLKLLREEELRQQLRMRC